MAILSIDTGERYYYYEDSDGNDVSMSSRGFFNYPNQPTQAPSFAYENDSSVKYNNLKNTVFQFAHRYVFADGRRSCYSPFSDVATQSSGEDLFGEALDSVDIGNKIVVTPSMPLFKHELSEVEIVFRQVLSSADTWSVWGLAGRITQYDMLETASPTFDFYNNVAVSIVDQEEVFTDYSALPRLADAQTSLMNNRVAYASITEGFDTVEPQITLDASFSEMDTSYGGDSSEEYEIINEVWRSVAGVDYHHKAIKIIDVPANGTAVVMNINGDTLSYVVSDSPSLAQLKSSLISVLSGAGYLAITDTQYLTTYGVNIGYSAVLVHDGYDDPEGGYNTYPIIGSLSVSVYESPAVAFTKVIGFKTGAVHPFCIYYYDELMRRSEPVVHDDLKIYLPFITQQDITNAGYIYKYNINWEVNHRPPSWAKYWRWGYAGNTSVGAFWQYSVSDVNTEEYIENTEIDITPLQTITDNGGLSGWQQLPNCNITPYSYEKGDRIRFITPAVSGTDIQTPFSTTEYVDGYYDYEIRDYDDENNIIYIDNIADEYSAFVIGSGSVVEIYRPRREDQDTLYYEIGTLLAIGEGVNGVYHVGETEDQEFDEYGVSLAPAEGVLRRGDIYHLLRQFSFDITTDSKPYPVESYSASDFYNSAVWAQGKSAYSTNIGEKKLNNIRWSDPLIQDSRINGVSMFQYDNYVSVNKKHGEITGMREVGHTLKVLQQSNNVSIGVGRTQYEDASGQSYVVHSDKILGTQRVSTSGYGCVNPESILQVGNYLYWFDALRGCMIRDAGGGAFPISGRYITPEGVADYKMEKFFHEIAQAVRWDSLNVFTAWDDGRKLLYVYTNKHKWVDLDGNEYTTVGINDQEWIVENFRCTKYADGSAIPNLQEAGSDGWYLPSKDEMKAMRDNLYLFGVGDITSSVYWTSSEASSAWANTISMVDGYEGSGAKSTEFVSRACRTFTAAEGAYSIRDVGPNGGLVFYASGTTYIEARIIDNTASVWSNIEDVAIGTTGTAIGTGAQNSLDIMGQAGHTDSAAKVCDDLSIEGWINTTRGAYCSYNNDSNNISDYGLLYNWRAVNTGIAYLSNNQGRGTGWRVPTDADWTNLITYIGGESLAGGYLKAAGTDYWDSPNTGATDLYGFNARGHGTRRETDAVFAGLKAEGVFWSSTGYLTDQAYRRLLLFSSGSISGGSNDINYGFGVRLVRDVPPDYRAYSDRCVVFHESSNRWASNIDIHDVLCFSTGASSMLSFIDSKALVHNHLSALKGTFNGVTYSPYTWVYSSEANHVNKLFHAIAVHSSVKPRIEDVYVHTEEVVGGMMRSKIFYKLIKKIEGVFKAEFLRHVGRTLAFSKAKLYNGDLLRGKTLKAKISYDATEDESDIQSGINIYKVDLECETSDT